MSVAICSVEEGQGSERERNEWVVEQMKLKVIDGDWTEVVMLGRMVQMWKSESKCPGVYSLVTHTEQGPQEMLNQ